MPDEAAEPHTRRRVRRGEGEVTEWPRGLVEYVPAGPSDATPSPEEDRVANRLALASRLAALLRTQGKDVDPELAQLRAAEREFARGRRAEAARAVDLVLEALERRRSNGGAAATR